MDQAEDNNTAKIDQDNMQSQFVFNLSIDVFREVYYKGIHLREIVFLPLQKKC